MCVLNKEWVLFESHNRKSIEHISIQESDDNEKLSERRRHKGSKGDQDKESEQDLLEVRRLSFIGVCERQRSVNPVLV